MKDYKQLSKKDLVTLAEIAERQMDILCQILHCETGDIAQEIHELQKRVGV